MTRPIKVTLATRPQYAAEGTVVEETDTGRELVFNAGHWHVIPSVTTYEEWRVTGTCSGIRVDKEFLPDLGYDEPEDSARAFVARHAENAGWTDGPHLHKRTVTVTDWTEVDT